MKIKTQYSLKEVRKLREAAAADTLFIVAAVLSDKYKFNGEKVEKFINECLFAADKINEHVVNRQDIKDIVNKNLGGKK